MSFLLSTSWFLATPGLCAQEEPEQPRGIGLSVEPGGLLIQYVKPGETYDLAQKGGIALKISNRSARPRTYQLSTYRPSEVGNRKWLEGYAEIPDPSWFWFEEEELTVEPESEGSVKMFLKVPEGHQYANQHWVVSIGVQGKAQTGEMLALAAYPRYQIETKSHADTEAVPIGSLGLAPSLMEFQELALGARQEQAIILYNNEATTRRYTLSVKTIPVDPTREQIVPSPGYTWIPEVSWVSARKKRVKLGAGKKRTLDVRVNVPDEPEHYDQQWEALLWIEPDEGRPRFARIQIDTIQAATGE